MLKYIYSFMDKFYTSSDDGKTWNVKNIKINGVSPSGEFIVEKITDVITTYNATYAIANDYYVIKFDNTYSCWIVVEEFKSNTHKLIKFLDGFNLGADELDLTPEQRESQVVILSNDGFLFDLYGNDVVGGSMFEVFEITPYEITNCNFMKMPLFCGKNGYISVGEYEFKIENNNWNGCYPIHYNNIYYPIVVGDNGYISILIDEDERHTFQLGTNNWNDVCVINGLILVIGDNGYCSFLDLDSITNEEDLYNPNLWVLKKLKVDDIEYSNNLNRFYSCTYYDGYLCICGDGIQISPYELTEYLLSETDWFLFYTYTKSIIGHNDIKLDGYTITSDGYESYTNFGLEKIKAYSLSDIYNNTHYIIRKILYYENYYYAMLEKVKIDNNNTVKTLPIDFASSYLTYLNTNLEPDELNLLKNHYNYYNNSNCNKVIAKSQDLENWTIIVNDIIENYSSRIYNYNYDFKIVDGKLEVLNDSYTQTDM